MLEAMGLWEGAADVLGTDVPRARQMLAEARARACLEFGTEADDVAKLQAREHALAALK